MHIASIMPVNFLILHLVFCFMVKIASLSLLVSENDFGAKVTEVLLGF